MPLLLPGAMVSMTGPSTVGTRTFPPRSASSRVIGRSSRMLSPSRRKNGWLPTSIDTIASPAPPGPCSPRPASRIWVPLSTPAGSLRSIDLPSLRVIRWVARAAASVKLTCNRYWTLAPLGGGPRRAPPALPMPPGPPPGPARPPPNRPSNRLPRSIPSAPALPSKSCVRNPPWLPRKPPPGPPAPPPPYPNGIAGLPSKSISPRSKRARLSLSDSRS